MLKRWVLFAICVTSMPLMAQQLSGRIEVALVDADDKLTYQRQGVGILRPEDNGVQFQQGFLRYQHQLSSSWSIDAVANYYEDGEQHFGFTQAYAQYKPLSPNPIKFKSRIGYFYPAMSIENVAEGWLSPYTYTQSAINSWIGEELRTVGGELSAFSNGRSRRSPWSWEAHLGVFKGNDPLGSLITWRGFAMHDRQSLHQDRINFARLPSVVAEDAINGPAWVEPFREVDGKWGFYVGGHLRYYRESELRYYYYDNKAEPNTLNSERLYAWRTKFHSIAVQHNINSNWRIMAQVLDGATDMGIRIVYADFTAWYFAVRYKQGKHSITARYDYWDVREDDNMPQDQNNNDGNGITVAWRYQLDENWELGAEFHRNTSQVENRQQVNLPTQFDQSQSRFVVSYQF